MRGNLWGRPVAVTRAGSTTLSRPTVRALLARMAKDDDWWTAIERTHFDGMVDGSVPTNVQLTPEAVGKLLLDRDISAYFTSDSNRAQHIVLHSYVESVDITCQRAEAAFAAEMQRRQSLAAELEQFDDPMVDIPWGRVGGPTHRRNAAKERAHFIIGNCNDDNPIATEARQARSRLGSPTRASPPRSTFCTPRSTFCMGDPATDLDQGARGSPSHSPPAGRSPGTSKATRSPSAVPSVRV